MHTEDIEIQAITQINVALKAIPDDATRIRVLKWAVQKFNAIPNNANQQTVSTVNMLSGQDESAASNAPNEIPKIASLNSDGNFSVIIQDLKAQSQTIAGVRLALATIHAYKKLTGNNISSRKDLVPVLKHFRLYDGNIRVALSRHRGIIRDKDILSLDAFAQKEAEDIIKEIQDPNTSGTWTPSKTIRKGAKKKDTAVAEK